MAPKSLQMVIAAMKLKGAGSLVKAAREMSPVRSLAACPERERTSLSKGCPGGE